MDHATLIWFLGGISASVGFLYVDRMREGRRITVMETKLDSIITNVDKLTGRLDLFLKTEVDMLKELAKKA